MNEINPKLGKIFNKKNLFFLAVMLAAFLASFLFFKKDYEVYRTEASIIVSSDKQTIETIALLPEKLSFYERVIGENKNIEDSFAGYPNDKRKEFWNNVISSEVESESSIIKISIKDKSELRSAELLNASVGTLFRFSDELYKNSKAVNLQVVENPISYFEIGNLPLLILFSSLLSLASGLIMVVFQRTPILVDAFLVFWGIDREDEGKEITKNVTKTTSKGIAYYFSDYALTALSPATVGFLKMFDWADWSITIIMWIIDVIIAYGFVVFSRNIIQDFTLTEALRASIETIKRKSKIVAFFLSSLILVRFSLWDGPERVAIFFKKELKGRFNEVMIIVVFSLVQAIFWTKLYSVGIDGLVKMFEK